MRITAATALYGVIGSPARHSLSPVLHNGWIADHGLDAVYLAFDCPEGAFETAVAGLLAAGAKGLNVTIPFKERAYGLATSALPSAVQAKAANVLSHQPLGLVADNTDGKGLILDLDTRAPHWREQPGDVVILGSGGAARGIATALLNAGLAVRFVVRTIANGHQLSDELGLPRTAVLPWDEIEASFGGAGLVINATSRGLKGNDPFSPAFAALPPAAAVYDTVYVPRETAFLAAARARGIVALDGLGMLVGQGALAFESWFGIKPDRTLGLARLSAELSR